MMVFCCYLLGLVCFLSSYLPTADSYVLKRDRYGEDENRLADALKVIARERQRLRDSEGDLYSDYYWEPSESARQEDYVDSDNFIQELFGEQEQEPVEEIPVDIDPRIFSDYIQGVEEVPIAEETPVDEAELEDIFGGDDEREREEKRTIPWQLGGRPYDKPDKKSSKAAAAQEIEEDDITKTQLSSNEVAKLLEDAEAVAQGEMDSETEPVSDEEIKNMLQGDDIPSDDDTAINLEETPDVESSSDQQTSIKRKRSGNMIAEDIEEIEEEPLELTEEEDDVIVETMEECLKQFIDLEDEENTKLAQALSLATLGQVERTDKYIPQEVDFLRGAVQDEDQIKQLRRCLRLGSQARGGVAGDAEEEEEEDVKEDVEKRMDEGPVIEPSEEMLEEIPEQTQEADIRDMLAEKLKLYLLQNRQQENEIDPEMFEDVIEDDEDPTLNPFYRELFEEYASAQQAPAKRMYQTEGHFGRFAEDPVEEEEVEEVEEPYTEEKAENEIRGKLSGYISEMTPGEREELKEEVAEALSALTEEELAEDEEIEEDMCPAVTSLADGCAYARQMDLELDADAMDLCNRHQLCYSCGSNFGLEYQDCDQGYLEEAERLCDSDGDCNDEAAGLFVVMIRGHRFREPSESFAQCQDQCVLDYIVGPNGDNL